ncbi:MAG: T9SS type A sorting domain-containing protein [Candidatus Marinimicrobia bacterium]|nr:T9SS type A sorting domain-containing protein [Candidatus Neomarinimicrobiota bacterium]
MKKICFFLLISSTVLWAQQINIPRVEQMPNMPQPYEMRNWKQVTMGYDSLVFDLTRTGDYLPLIWINNNTVNYPSHNSFGLHTVVGTPYPSNAEAINALPAVISATLVGIDKSDQNGHNWVLGCEEWFNRRPAENVYLNNFVSSSGDDFWYHTMPNVFFYQLYDLYPETGDFKYQFTSVANQWLTAVKKMGGSAAPWNKASMNYRGWYLSTMTPYTTGIKEPEAAGAIAWLLYNAYVRTGDVKYRQGAEWAMEFLSDFSSNAAYELQLPYGVYAAARMNAELNTEYEVEKMLNWCFDPTDNVRGWGVTLGTWGDYDCDGLIGEAVDEGYAFAMNGYEMAGALIPMVRYDDRFARSIGKWVLNLANASRLYYTPFLPDSLQDGEAWAKVYDPRGYIAHESMRETEHNWGVSPFATGDAIAGSWGATNFALYGSSHVGIMGGIIDTTNIEGILRLNVCKTDYFQDESFPTYLFYNPHDEDKTIEFDLGWQTVDIYDAVTNQILVSYASGMTNLTIPADDVVLAVYLPVGGTTAYKLNKMLYNEIMVDYNAGLTVENYAPRIKALSTGSPTVMYNESIDIYCTAMDRDDDSLSYSWKIGNENLVSDSSILSWTAPQTDTTLMIYCYVSDGIETVADSIQIEIIESINIAPVINDIVASAGKIDMGDTTLITCIANDTDSDELVYEWSADFGTIIGADSSIYWIAPDTVGYFYTKCMVNDNRGGFDVDSIGIVVSDSSNSGVGDPVAWYPFSSNANDMSGMANHGTVSGATLTEDRFGNVNSAYYFNGTNNNIRVPVSESLNFTDAITVSFWMNAAELYSTRESYPISHGNWENRWKISINPDKKVRWTLKSRDGIKDLDSDVQVTTNTWYHVVGLYDGENFEIYLNGAISNHTSFSGKILTTNIDLMIGQVLPNSKEYNFKGIIDDVRIYNYALSVEDIEALYRVANAIHTDNQNIPENFALMQNYPNPFNPVTTIGYQIPTAGNVRIEIFDLSGKLVETLVSDIKQAGDYSVIWNAQNVSSGIYLYRMQVGNYNSVRKCIRLK